AQVQEVLKALGEGATPSGNFRIITLDKGSAATVAEEIKRLMSGLRENPIKIQTPGLERPPERIDKPQTPEKNSRGEEQDEPPAAQQQAPQPANKPQLVDPQAPKPGKKDSPVTMTAVGNKLLITSDDPEALALVQELYRLLTQRQEGDGD